MTGSTWNTEAIASMISQAELLPKGRFTWAAVAAHMGCAGSRVLPMSCSPLRSGARRVLSHGPATLRIFATTGSSPSMRTLRQTWLLCSFPKMLGGTQLIRPGSAGVVSQRSTTSCTVRPPATRPGRVQGAASERSIRPRATNRSIGSTSTFFSA